MVPVSFPEIEMLLTCTSVQQLAGITAWTWLQLSSGLIHSGICVGIASAIAEDPFLFNPHKGSCVNKIALFVFLERAQGLQTGALAKTWGWRKASNPRGKHTLILRESVGKWEPDEKQNKMQITINVSSYVVWHPFWHWPLCLREKHQTNSGDWEKNKAFLIITMNKNCI